MIVFYKPENTIRGPAYNPCFQFIATIVTIGLVIYGTAIALRFPLMEYGIGIRAVLVGAAVMLIVSLYWFLRASVTIDDDGITQTGLLNRHVEWRDVRSARMLGIPYTTWLFPPRLVVRTGNSFSTFNGGTRELLVEFAKISRAFQLRK
jgi:hypothetical protein